jgi:hypothetical protein
MTVQFTQEYVEECEKKFDLKRQNVIDTYTNSDKKQRLLADGLAIHFFLKQFDEYYLLVCGSKQSHEPDLKVSSAYKLMRDFVSQQSGLEPLDILKSLAMKYGLLIKIGNKQSKFYFNELVPLHNVNGTNTLGISNPLNHSFMQNFWIRINDNGYEKVAQCALVYCLDTTEYVKSLK